MKGVAILFIGLLVSSAGTDGMGESPILKKNGSNNYFDHKCVNILFDFQ